MFTPEEIMSEVKKIQYLYGLKKEIRYAQTRPETDTTESVAEHVYGMHICALYFLPLENPAGDWNLTRIFEMITLHDIDEIETGDVIGYTKTDAMRAAEADSMRIAMQKSPASMQSMMAVAIDEYDVQVTPESRFVKAVDKFEPLIHMYNEAGKQVAIGNKQTRAQAESIKEPYLRGFPLMYQFYQEIHAHMEAEGFWSE
jgi:5'-deoxynucleotidase YfbR-like HD superfamily hydrolase